jgi:hypothetical protein
MVSNGACRGTVKTDQRPLANPTPSSTSHIAVLEVEYLRNLADDFIDEFKLPAGGAQRLRRATTVCSNLRYTACGSL